MRIVLLLLSFVSLPAFAQTTVAGSTPGSFRVTEGGAAEYRIPIRVPPGIAGMEPRLALVYNSQAGNDLLGMGWHLEGLSEIRRCPQTLAQDSFHGGVNLDADDRFCLDGERLILTSGGAYGAGATEYRTERERFSRVQASTATVAYARCPFYTNPVCGSSYGVMPESFTVKTKSGITMQYGTTTDSRSEAQGAATVRLWALSRMSDTSGNYLTVSYTENQTNGEHLVDRVDYSGNQGAGVSPGYSVRFIYETRPDARSGYVAGSRLDATSRLNKVQVYAATSLVKEYRFSYQASSTTGRSRLSEVSECDGSGSCLPPTTFAWQNATAGWTSTPSFAPPTAISHYTGSTNIDYGVRVLDVNGDGLPDYLKCEGGSSCQAWLNTGSGWQTSSAYAPPTPLTYFYNNFNIDYGVRIVDVTGDGLPDYLQCEGGGGGCHAWINTGTGWQQSTAYAPPVALTYFFVTYSGAYVNINYGVEIIDVTGDGLPDFLQCETAGSCKAWVNTGSGWQQNNAYAPPTAISHFTGTVNVDYGVRIVDVTGDGLPDYLQCETDGLCKAWVNTGAGWRQNNAYAPPTAISHFYNDININYGVQIVDVNGDGLADYLQCETAGACKAWMNTGAGWQQNIAYAPPTAISNFTGSMNLDYGVRIVDVTGDGLPDYLQCETAGSCKAWVNTGSGWQQNNVYAPPTAISHYVYNINIDMGVRIEDLNGDGLPDYLQCETAGSCSAYKSTGPFPDLLTSATNGTNASATIAYATTAAATVHSREVPGAYPAPILTMPLHVVSSHAASDGIGGSQQTTHAYTDAKVQVQGRGFLGFKKVKATSVSTGTTVTTTYSQDWPYAGFPSSVKKTQSSGAVLGETTNTYACTNPATGAPCTVAAGNRYFPFASQSVETGNDLNGAALPTVTTTTAYDNYGNATSVVVSTGDGYSKTTTNTFANDVANWFLGRLTRSTVQSVTP
jgi:hypothetical protein